MMSKEAQSVQSLIIADIDSLMKYSNINYHKLGQKSNRLILVPFYGIIKYDSKEEKTKIKAK